ncbi:MAG: tetratricopeptide repeat protein [Thermoguttaceae bacterium]|nr:tetratricopeptide repeat protein [Thermoguttaceae bacterium]
MKDIKELYNSGMSYMMEQRFSEAEAAFLEALTILQKRNAEKPGEYEDFIARTKNMLGFLYSQMERISEAESYMTEAREIYRRLVGENPDAYNDEFSEDLINLGRLYLNTERYSESEASFLESLTVLQNKTNTAFVRLNLSDLYAKTNRYSQAEENYNEALKIYRLLAVEEPEEYNHCVLQTLEYLARLHLKQNRFSEAEAELNEAINICQNLNESEDSQESIGGIKHSIAYIYMESLHDYSRAKQLLLESLSIYEKLHERHSEEIINYSDSLNAIKSALSYLEEDENGSSNKD